MKPEDVTWWLNDMLVSMCKALASIPRMKIFLQSCFCVVPSWVFLASESIWGHSDHRLLKQKSVNRI